MTDFPFEIHATQDRARTGKLVTPRGEIRTPAFMPVGTAATVKALYTDQVADAGADILLGNTYHLMLRPGSERVHRLGGLHKFMRWDKPILTDSGGFQVWSLAGLRKMKEEGVSFKSHIDGSSHFLSPERSIEIQADHLGADISMQLDECTEYPATHEQAKSSMEMSIRWGARSKAAFGERNSQTLFGIVQGSDFEDLRQQSAEALQEIGFGGYAIGGLAVGEGHNRMVEVIDFTEPHLPRERPRYLMGVGKPIDILEAVAHGVDMFDCVLPTRSGRHGQAWTWDGPINLKNARFAEDDTPIDPNSSCPASRDYSKAYLNHLFKAGEYLAPMLLSWHNTAFFQEFMQTMRTAIANGTFNELRADLKSRWT
ncbi:tRNA guanosine(34) transglycosylase Tgt [Ponticaulis sp.]|uniref:tRNA guanosine(34) transglycosylase Tgt n=1 Tax=Ponticaulis sp. TaxID=2020902 RepID=UPI000C366478|nr:tRNA guanosine(34) transglycosylase Tgt [Ponticaulis sp.]MAF58265.1 tRNA guanosine(34) transglycosylase Tgt [Ponticaulis sp.]MBN04798.1 tRNA guanosine(34) transglycosylase Tgt [Ponticaulis sp.]|tara:strand:+ start:324 stop:1433 length:1110 start_codon:yes stop_codon:yes gene_type:complete